MTNSIVLLILAGVVGRSAYSEEVSFEEIRTGYQKNIQSLGAFSFRLHSETRSNAEHCDVLTQRIARVESVFDKISDADQEKVRSYLEMNKAKLRNSQIAFEEGIRSSSSVLIGPNSIFAAVPGQQAVGIIPELPIKSKENFLVDFANYHAACWSTKQQPNSWHWQGFGGRPNKGVYYATISKKYPWMSSKFFLPAIGLRDHHPFEMTQLGPSDYLFTKNFDELTVKTEMLDDQQVYLIEAVELSNIRKTTKAWISPETGFFPVRIETAISRLFPQEDRVLFPSTIIRFLAFHERDGGFYPAAWTIEEKADDDRSPESRVRGKKLKSFLHTTYMHTWRVKNFKAHLDEPELFSKIGFPNGTQLYDEDKDSYTTVEE